MDSIRIFLLSTLLLSAFVTKASHTVGGDMYYEYVGMSGMQFRYKVVLNLYSDVINGQPDAIAQDNPAYIAVYRLSDSSFETCDTSIYFTSSGLMPVFAGANPCGYTSLFPLSLLRKTYVTYFNLPSSISGYLVSYQRCCRNSAISNVVSSGDIGITYFCTIPGTSLNNNAPVFNNYPPQIVAINKPFSFNHSATDADGDSLSYELCNAYVGGSTSDIKPFPLPGPYSFVNYMGSYSYANPMGGTVPLHIDSVTGILTVTPNVSGRFLVSVACKEWRAHTLLSTVRRDFQFVVSTFGPGTFQTFAGNDTSVLIGDSIQFNAVGGSAFNWSPGTFLNDTTIANPIGHYTSTGTISYVLTAVDDSGCVDIDTLNVGVLSGSKFYAPNAFTPNNDGRNDVFKPVGLGNGIVVSIKIFSRYGVKIYEGVDGWDGTYKGEVQPMDAYMWELVYKDNAGQVGKMGGKVTLVK